MLSFKLFLDQLNFLYKIWEDGLHLRMLKCSRLIIALLQIPYHSLTIAIVIFGQYNRNRILSISWSEFKVGKSNNVYEVNIDTYFKKN